MYKEGLPYLERDFPELDYITSCAVREIATSGGSGERPRARARAPALADMRLRPPCHPALAISLPRARSSSRQGRRRRRGRARGRRRGRRRARRRGRRARRRGRARRGRGRARPAARRARRGGRAASSRSPRPRARGRRRPARRRRGRARERGTCRCATTKGPIVLEVHRRWAPLGAARFLALVGDGFFSSKAREKERSNVLPLSLRSRT